MKLLACLPLLLLAAAPAPLPSPPVAEVPLGKFQAWKPQDGRIAFAAEGLRVTVDARPCTAEEMPSDACQDRRGIHSSANITIERDGAPAYRTEVNTGAYYRIALVRLEHGDKLPALIVESDPGGSGGGVVETVIRPLWHNGPYGSLMLDYPAMGLPHGDRTTFFSSYIADYPEDLNGDGFTDFVLGDGKFAGSPFGCHACERLPPLILSVGSEGAVDVSRDPAFRPLFEKALAEHRDECIHGNNSRNPACAAWVADAARLGQFDAAWKQMLPHYVHEGIWEECEATGHPCPAGRLRRYKDFPDYLHAFLKKAGYIS